MKRLSDSKKRPLLKFEDLEKNLEVILQERKDIYKLANFKIDCNHNSKTIITNKIDLVRLRINGNWLNLMARNGNLLRKN